MTSRFAPVAALLLLGACASTPAAVTPDATPLAAPAATAPAVPAATATAPAPPAATAPPAVRPIEGATFEAALAAARLTKVEITTLQRIKEHAPAAEPMKAEGRRIALTLTAGWNAETLEFARDPAGRLVRLRRQPDVTVKETVFQGCQEHAFAGGRGWFERVVFELPEGTTWGGEQIVKYPVVKEVTRFTGKKADGKDCPPPNMARD